jgi:hypothetical protein
MALTKDGKKALGTYFAKIQPWGEVPKMTITAAIKLTDKQRDGIEEHLIALWNQPSYTCPAILDLKPRHGYISRVIKDQFPVTQYEEWLDKGCSDLAIVATDNCGRPRLVVATMRDYPKYTYSIVIPIRSDAHGSVHIDDVIPEGLPKGAKK